MNFISEDQISGAAANLATPIQLHNRTFDSVHSPGATNPTSLVFVSTAAMLKQAMDNKVQGFIVLEKNYSQVKQLIPASSSLWTTTNIQHALTRILPLFDKKNLAYPETGTHRTAVIDPAAQVAKSAKIGAYAVIQKGVQIGEDVIIGSHTIIEAFASVGESSIISPHVYIGSFCKIGNRCIIAPHVTIGSDGFGYFSDKNGHHKIPQIGDVIIEDDCEIGGNCVIDRATLESTIIRRGSKLDNLCHIAHNVDIGENALLTGAFKTAGSSKFGKNLITGGNVDINGHIEIGDNVILAGRTGVIHSIKEPGMYGGFPAEPQRDNIKTMVSLSHLARIRKNVQKIMKHLQLEDTKE